MAKDRLLSCLQANKSVLDLMICSGKRTVTGEMKLETLNSTIASFFLKSFAFNAADATVWQLWLISVNLTLCTLAYAHKHCIIHDPSSSC